MNFRKPASFRARFKQALGLLLPIAVIASGLSFIAPTAAVASTPEDGGIVASEATTPDLSNAPPAQEDDIPASYVTLNVAEDQGADPEGEVKLVAETDAQGESLRSIHLVETGNPESKIAASLAEDGVVHFVFPRPAVETEYQAVAGPVTSNTAPIVGTQAACTGFAYRDKRRNKHPREPRAVHKRNAVHDRRPHTGPLMERQPAPNPRRR